MPLGLHKSALTRTRTCTHTVCFITSDASNKKKTGKKKSAAEAGPKLAGKPPRPEHKAALGKPMSAAAASGGGGGSKLDPEEERRKALQRIVSHKAKLQVVLHSCMHVVA